MTIAVTTGFVGLLALVFIGVPYYQAYQRRKELQRKRSADCGGGPRVK